MSRRAARNQRTAPAPAGKDRQPARAVRPVRVRLAAWHEQHLHGLGLSLARLAARPAATLLTTLVLGFALALPLLFWLAVANAREWTGGLREAREVTLFLQPGLARDAAEGFAAELRRRPDVATVVVRTPEQGLEEFRRLAGFGEALDALAANPLPFVLVVTPRGEGAAGDELAAALGGEPRVDLVQYDAAWRRRLGALLGFGERALGVLAALLAGATLLVVGNTVRMDIHARSEEISVMQMIGASNGFVRRPFLYAGLWYGLLGAACALLIVFAIELALAAPLGDLLASYGGRLSVRGIGVGEASVLLAAGGFLGWIGAHVVAGRRLAAGQPA
jgi:cell division transport system permease protein